MPEPEVEQAMAQLAQRRPPLEGLQKPFEAAMDALLGLIGVRGDVFEPTSIANALGVALGSVPMLPKMGKAIKAYHGSPHDFDQFSLSKIGTGEGAQAYGHGLYFAENEGTAKAYRDQLSQGTTVVVDGVKRAINTESGEDLALMHLASGSTGPQATAAIRRGFTPQYANEYESALQKYAGRVQPIRGRMYEVNIHADPETFLDWDAPIGMQGESIRNNPLIRELQAAEHYGYSVPEFRALPEVRRGELMAKIPGGAKISAPGARVYDTLAAEVGGDNPALASDALKKAGVPGIKYLDQGSRMTAGVNKFGDNWFIKGSSTPYPTEQVARKAAEEAGNVTRNYVVFDDALIEILKKYGWMLPAAGLYSQQEQR